MSLYSRPSGLIGSSLQGFYYKWIQDTSEVATFLVKKMQVKCLKNKNLQASHVLVDVPPRSTKQNLDEQCTGQTFCTSVPCADNRENSRCVLCTCMWGENCSNMQGNVQFWWQTNYSIRRGWLCSFVLSRHPFPVNSIFMLQSEHVLITSAVTRLEQFPVAL